MNRDQVLLAMGEPFRTVVEDNGNEKWMYSRSNGVIFDVWFDHETGLVVNGKARKGTDDDKKATTTAKRKKPSPVRKITQKEYTETDGDFTTGTPIQ
jgi:outer membrane protein assembly factor BamE (lipoprotein component of BamABCDE complex)